MSLTGRSPVPFVAHLHDAYTCHHVQGSNGSDDFAVLDRSSSQDTVALFSVCSNSKPGPCCHAQPQANAQASGISGGRHGDL